MQKEYLKNKNIPQTPGVYFFLNKQKKVLYIGKATSLKDRTKSYFAKDLVESRSPTIVKMVEEAHILDYRTTDSVLEALILEANLIKTYKPKYNTLLKDDKSYNYVVITNEAFPRVLKVRGKDLSTAFKKSEIKKLFGPFPYGNQLTEALLLIRKIFPFFDTKHPVGSATSKTEKGKIAFYQSLGIYPKSDADGVREYAKTIRHIILLFSGKKKQLLDRLSKEMEEYAHAELFERAGERKRQLYALKHIRDISLIKREALYEPGSSVRIEAYDIAHTSGKEMVGVMTVVENGEVQKTEYRKFIINGITSADDTGALKQVLERRCTHHEWRLPTLMVVDGAKAQLSVAQKVLASFGYEIPVVAVTKDEHHKAKEIIGIMPPALSAIASIDRAIILANAEAHRFAIEWHRKKRQRASFGE